MAASTFRSGRTAVFRKRDPTVPERSFAACTGCMRCMKSSNAFLGSSADPRSTISLIIWRRLIPNDVWPRRMTNYTNDGVLMILLALRRVWCSIEKPIIDRLGPIPRCLPLNLPAAPPERASKTCNSRRVISEIQLGLIPVRSRPAFLVDVLENRKRSDSATEVIHFWFGCSRKLKAPRYKNPRFSRRQIWTNNVTINLLGAVCEAKCSPDEKPQSGSILRSFSKSSFCPEVDKPRFNFYTFPKSKSSSGINEYEILVQQNILRD